MSEERPMKVVVTVAQLRKANSRREVRVRGTLIG
jgi:hypothetical protein